MTTTLWQWDRKARDLIVRGRDYVLSSRWRRSGQPVTVSSAFVTVRDSRGGVVLQRTSATVTNALATATLPAASTEGRRLEQGWFVVWEAVFPGETEPREFPGEAALVLYQGVPVVTAADLEARISRLSPQHTAPLLRDLDLDAKIDEAWREIERRLYATGRRPELVMSPEQFRTPHQLLALEMVFDELRLSEFEAYESAFQRYKRLAGEAWGALTFQYDADQDGLPDGGSSAHREGTGESTVWTNARGSGIDYPWRD